MTVRELIRELTRDDVDPNAEVMISAPLACDRGRPGLVGHLDLPTRAVETGHFAGPKDDAFYGKPWAMIMGTDVWSLLPSGKLRT